MQAADPRYADDKEYKVVLFRLVVVWIVDLQDEEVDQKEDKGRDTEEGEGEQGDEDQSPVHFS